MYIFMQQLAYIRMILHTEDSHSESCSGCRYAGIYVESVLLPGSGLN